MDAGDQLLANVAREVEIDVGRLCDLLVQEAPQEQPVAHRVDVREPGQVADDRADAGAAPAPRRQQRPRGVRPPHLGRHLAGQLQDVEVEQEEPRQSQGADHPELLLQPPPRPPPLAPIRVPVFQPGPADLGQRPVGVGVLRARVPVAEVAGQVEAEPLGDPGALRDGVGMLREAGGHRRRRGQMGRGVPTPLGLGLLERPLQAHRDQRVLKRRPRGVVHVDVAARHARNPEPPGEILQPAIARPVVAPERPLKLDPEALGAEGARQPAPQRLRRLRLGSGRATTRALERPRERSLASTPREADEPLRPLLQRGQRQDGGRGSRSGLGRVSRCASVISRHRFRHPSRLSTRSVR